MLSLKTLASRLLAVMFLAALFAAGGASPAAAQAPRSESRLCANEDGYCRFSGPRYVRYGANDRFTVLLLKDGTECSNLVFGDPLPGVRKACYVEGGVAPSQRCAEEDGRCSFYGTRDVFYGAGDRFVVRPFTNGTACTNAVFGDPAPGVRKACYLEGGSPTPRGALCAQEDGRCRFTGTRVVYYGAGDRFAALVLTNGANCTNATFGDPVPGVRKACYVER
jgi:hypothetical protein